MKSKLVRIVFISALVCLGAGRAGAIEATLGRFSIAKQAQIRDFSGTSRGSIRWRSMSQLPADACAPLAPNPPRATDPVEALAICVVPL